MKILQTIMMRDFQISSTWDNGLTFFQKVRINIFLIFFRNLELPELRDAMHRLDDGGEEGTSTLLDGFVKIVPKTKILICFKNIQVQKRMFYMQYYICCRYTKHIYILIY